MKIKKILILLFLFAFLANIGAFAAAATVDKATSDKNIAILKDAWKDYTAKNYDSAYTKFEGVSKEIQSWAEPYDGMGWCQYQKKNYQQAEELFAKALKAYPGYSSSLNGLYYVSMWRYSNSNKAWELYNNGKYDDAIQAFNGVLNQTVDQYPKSEMWSIYDGLGWSYYWKKDYKNAGLNFQTALKQLPNYADAQKGLGFIAYKDGGYKKAIDYLSKAGNYYYLDLTIKTTLAWSYYKSGDTKKAKDIFSYALQINPYTVVDKDFLAVLDKEKGWLTLHNDMGWGYYGLKEYSKAEKEFDTVLKTEPKNYVALTGMGYIKYQQKKYDDAVKYITKAFEANPSTFAVNETVTVPGAIGQYYIVSDGNTTVAWSYFYKNDLTKAEQHFKKALVKNNWVDAHDGLGWVYLKQKKYDLAEKEFASALRYYPAYASSIMGLNEVGSKKYADSNKAWTSFYKGDFKKAIEQFRLVLNNKASLYPKNEKWALYNGLGWASYLSKDYDSAVKNFQDSINLYPSSADSYDGLGWSLLKKGDTAGAEKAFNTALKLYPKYQSSLKGIDELNKSKK